ncbi:Myg1p NDAI_0C06000 [Naumovozyma dairenensis CBS 421]|uniref:Uncharacterized protein n=1 Tax=Naumovozyma dairenensis (strain ATCC 10597 / BCRC 20456 / CBS 421 / NBRC 0211 / NRRL Y-12639) TaxID=1071378 RepID=G0W8Z8_NAUDC|nr:hypothetical protein NDAI_0C06000 [Naumovozyma dairenensis CBS 421]CCD24259.1 hypothetical protein NDAI_0C06000 [Naumovozyma dairenensis CBS 421]
MSVKRIKLAEMAKQICTHSGSFHADDALAVYLLRLLPEYKDAKVIRSRNPEDWDASDIVVDVGAKYDSVKFFDHHQRGFDETFSDKYKTKLSSAGLVFKHFGKRIIELLVTKNITLTPENVDLLYIRVYERFVEALDADDNGISQYDTDLEPRFKNKSITIPGIVAGLNPNWNDDCSPAIFDENFLKASEFVGSTFVNLVKGYGESWLPAKSLVKEAIAKNETNDKRIIVLDQFCPWKEHLYDIEKELNLENKIQFVIFKDSSNSWRVSTVPVSSTSFQFRKGLPEHLRGLRDEELSEKSGVPDCIFIHSAGFIGGAKTKESALKLAKMSL